MVVADSETPHFAARDISTKQNWLSTFFFFFFPSTEAKDRRQVEKKGERKKSIFGGLEMNTCIGSRQSEARELAGSDAGVACVSRFSYLKRILENKVGWPVPCENM